MKTTILIFDSSNNTGSPYIDRFNENHSIDTLDQAQGFDSIEEANNFIEAKEFGSWASVSEIEHPETIEETDAQS